MPRDEGYAGCAAQYNREDGEREEGSCESELSALVPFYRAAVLPTIK